jgi:RNA polymerase sigma factor (sigma-70 family)
MSDHELLRRYAEERSQAAFAEFVRGHIDLVHAAAMRRLDGDAHGAADVAQQVFIAAARDAGRLARHANVSGWLYTATRHAALNILRETQRRLRREQAAQAGGELFASSTLPASLGADPAAEADWERVRPMLDRALDDLSEADREAVLLRFFEGRSFVEMGPRLRLSENGARMRVDRALDKLRARLAQAGLTSTAATLASALAREGSAHAPAGLAASVASGVFKAASTGTSATMGALLGAGFTFARLKAGLAFGGAFVAAVAVVSWATGINPFLPEPSASSTAVVAPATPSSATTKTKSDAANGHAVLPDARRLYDEGLQHVRAWRYDEAFTAFSQAIELDPNFNLPYLQRADLYALRRQQHEKAVADYTTALGLKPNDVWTRHRRAELYRRPLRDNERAIADYTAIIESYEDYARTTKLRDSSLVQAYTLRGEIRQETLQDYAAAIVDFTEALRLTPNDYMLLAKRAKCHQALKNYAAAEEDFAAGFKIEPYSTHILAGWAWQLATAPDPQFRDASAALQLALRANELYPGDATHMETLAAAYAETGRFDEAVAIQQRAMASLIRKSTDSAMQSRLATYAAKQPYRDR